MVLVLSFVVIAAAQAVPSEPQSRPASIAAADLPIYTDALAGGWQDWSWDTTRSFDNTQPVHSGSASIAITYTVGWGGLSLHTNTPLPVRDYTVIRFWVHGGSAGGQSVRFYLKDGGESYSFTVPANTWLPVTVPLAAFGSPTTLSDLVWQDESDHAQPTFYLDDISLSAPSITTTTRVSVDSSGIQQGDYPSDYPSISADGRYVAFSSDASNLVSGDTNGYQDVFVRDTQTGTTTRVSVDSSGAQGNSGSFYHAVSISADGRYVAFSSFASNLVNGDTNGAEDIFLHDRQTGATTRLSLDSSGVQGSGDHPSISADGRYVAFKSAASNLVSGDTNDSWDIFLRDTQTGITTRVSVDSSGAQAIGDYYTPALSISADGRYVAFDSFASNLVSGDTNGTEDIFVHDTQTGTTIRASVDSSGIQGNNMSSNPSISADGRYVTFDSDASNLASECGGGHIFLRDTRTGITTCLSVNSSGVHGNSTSFFPSISADGRYVAFKSWASDLVSGDTNDGMDIFLRDTQTGTTTRLSLNSSGAQGNGDSFDLSGPSISADGRYVAFSSEDSNLVSGDTNGYRDVFVVPVTRIFALTVSKTGTGRGTVTSNLGGIDCGATCSYYFDNNTAVTLTATASTGSTFTSWSGSGCSGTSTCTVTMDAARSVTANFTQNKYTLTITSTNGTVARNPNQATYHEGDVVQLTATPDTGWSFANWTGDLTSSVNPDSVTIHGNTSVTANFTPKARIYLPAVFRSFGAGTPHLPYAGVNLAGADFGEDVLPGTYGFNYIYPNAGEVDYFTRKGMAIFRLPVRWERLQHTQLAGFDADEQARMDTFVNYATGKGAYVLLDPHNYARYYGNIIGESAVPVAAYTDFWSRLANHYRSNGRVIFGLMNEPNTMSTELWVSDANAAIQAIRLTGATNLILVPGNAWSGASSWGENWYGTPNAVAMLGITDSANNYAFEVHQYLDSDGSGTSETCVSSTIGSERMAYFTSWLRQNSKRGFLGEFGGSTNGSCLAAIDDILTHLDQNSDIYLGWTYWAAGPWWGDYPMGIEPIGGVDRPQMTPLSHHLP